jgi:hypothetical protein
MLQRRPLDPKAKFIDEKRTQCDGIIRPADTTVA